MSSRTYPKGPRSPLAPCRARLRARPPTIAIAAVALLVIGLRARGTAEEYALAWTPSRADPAATPSARAPSQPPPRGAWLRDAPASTDLGDMLRTRAHEGDRGISARESSALLLDMARWMSQPLHLRLGPELLTRSDHDHVVPRSSHAVVLRYEGIERIAAAELRRKIRRLHRDTLATIYDQRGLDRRWDHERDDAEAVVRQDPLVEARFEQRFPSYWVGHERARAPEVVVVGETIELLEVFGYDLTNDLRLRRPGRLRARADASRAASSAGAAAAHPDARPRHPASVRRRQTSPRGNVYANDWCALDADGRLRISSFEPRLIARVHVRIYDDLYDEEFVRMLLAVEVEPLDRSVEVALLIQVRSF